MSVFDDLGVPGKPALPSFLKFQTCKNASSGLRDTVLGTEATGVFFHDGGLIFTVLPITSLFLVLFRPIKCRIEALDVLYPMVKE